MDDVPTGIFAKYPDLLSYSFSEEYNFEKCYTRTGDGPFCELDVAAALVRCAANVSSAAALLGRGRRSTENFIARNLLLTELFEDLEAAFLDQVEELHRSAALSGDLATQRFFLTTKGKNRGYTTRNENTGKDGAPFEFDMKLTSDAEHFTRTIAGLAARIGETEGTGGSDAGS